MKRAAFFDFDNTIYNGYTFYDFISYASKIKHTDVYQDEYKYILKTAKLYNDTVSKIASPVGKIVEKWPQNEFENYCRASCNRSKILNWTMPVINFLKSVNFENIIISASFEEMLADSIDVLQIDEIYCSCLDLVNHEYSGKIRLLRNGEEKVEVIKRVLSTNTFSIAFGDSMGDIPMFETVNLAILVRSNNLEVENIAKQKGWFIGDDSTAIINRIQNELGN